MEQVSQICLYLFLVTFTVDSMFEKVLTSKFMRFNVYFCVNLLQQELFQRDESNLSSVSEALFTDTLWLQIINLAGEITQKECNKPPFADNNDVHLVCLDVDSFAFQ